MGRRLRGSKLNAEARHCRTGASLKKLLAHTLFHFPIIAKPNNGEERGGGGEEEESENGARPAKQLRRGNVNVNELP